MTIQTVCVLGNGQLGRMLRQAGEPLGIHVYPVGLDVDPATIPYQNSVITAEIERWPQTPFTQILASHPHFVNRDVFPIIADRLSQKQLLDQLNLPTAKWYPVNDEHEWSSFFEKLGDLLIVKRRIGGYDGRGQWRLTVDAQIPDEACQNTIVEQAIPFEKELSLVGARNANGETVFYPLTNNLHQDGILKMSVAIPYENNSLQKKAEQMLSSIMHKLNYVGVMAMECFVVGDNLLINELAPRVHNSGHWTQNGASISQFELHLRAILGLPLPNLAHLHWYEKEVRVGRKVGHINLSHQHRPELIEALSQLSALLPTEYSQPITWAIQKL